jgi:hypothetical protein
MTDLAARIAQLLRLILISDKPGEAIAAIEALKRALQAAGLDAHALADAAAARLDHAQSQSVPFGAGEWRQMVNACQRHGNHLSGREQRFLNTLSAYRSKPTEKQLLWLADIFARLRGAA